MSNHKETEAEKAINSTNHTIKEKGYAYLDSLYCKIRTKNTLGWYNSDSDSVLDFLAK